MTSNYAETILNSLSAHIAIIDGNGTIMETNRAWQEFAQSNAVGMRPDMLNINYLEICDGADDPTGDSAREVAQGIRRVIRREIDEFVMDYPCHSPEEQRWFYMRAIRVPGSDPLRVVISHENITELKLAEQKVRQREQELEQKSIRLGEANAALRVLLRQRDEDLHEMEAAFFRNIKQSVLPYVEELKKSAGLDGDRQLISLIESELNHIASPFLRRISNLEAVLTPQELRIASLIKENRSSKEIADILNLSMTTINFHRRNLREKLGLKHTRTNLSTFLNALSD